jgi:hypothetical protein
MSTLVKGRITEATVLAAFVKHGYAVSVPFGDGQPYDLVVDIDGAFLRVQCKTARRLGACLMFHAKSTDHGHGNRSYRGLADVFGVVYPTDESVYLVPVADVSSRTPYLRLEATRNNQRSGIRFAADYAFERWAAEDLRAIAGSTDRGRLIAA